MKSVIMAKRNNQCGVTKNGENNGEKEK